MINFAKGTIPINPVRLGKLQFTGRFPSRLLLDALGAAIHMLATFSLFVVFYQEGSPNRFVFRDLELETVVIIFAPFRGAS